jgi:hypothetical protein
MKGFEELFIVAWMLFGILLTPLFFIGFDYWSIILIDLYITNFYIVK